VFGLARRLLVSFPHTFIDAGGCAEVCLGLRQAGASQGRNMRNSEYKIVPNVPLPRDVSSGGAHRSGGRKPKYPLADMQIGDSFVVNDGETFSVRACIQTFRANNRGREFVTRRLGDGKTRVWRTA
jgi:hypothetical protein